ncbi:hypothetical protein ACFL6S_04160 [Candidatus Poribacteria bacterium]
MSIAALDIDIDIEELWAEKIEQLSGMVMRIARGDEDNFQVGILGIRDGLLRDPYATDSYLLQASRYAMTNYKNRGRSVDNGSRHPTTKKLLDGTVRTYQKRMVPVYMDKLISEFGMEFPDHSYAPDVLALDRIGAERFYRSLDDRESEFINACMMNRHGDFSPRKTMQNLGISATEYHRIRRAAYWKFIRAFGTDEDIEKLEERLDEWDSYQ